ncbi:carbohydrate ABC transporter permease [Microbacterium sp. JZ70]|uniref:Sugar ABC transporter permease n=1 Tax=Microbacterium barkeri TaxID=33917 RepID=A0A9W6H664_9MICO|nr:MULTISPECIES: carbohydrate ABC transporter permease [Microbacterium]MDR6876853.1 N,N'-diacetylchitobiose transport system permease protein [Microbacterium barkeri]WRH16776.1 ABC transporter permease subunit [Microbacterium sp. JZ37]GLJ62834.1 sugar ABC transporter permease [Microbacterium barkeri]
MSSRPRSRVARAGLNALAVVVFLASAFPVYWMVNSALLPNAVVTSSEPHWWPDRFTLANFVEVVTEPSGSIAFLPALAMSVGVTLAAVVFALLFAFLAALALSRFRFRSRRALIVAVLAIQMIPAEALIISTYRVLDGWQLLNSAVGLALVYIAMVLPFTIWTLRGFVNGVPIELEEAARVDGCTRMGAFWRVTFPLLGPGLAATGVFAFIQAWNEFVYALVIMTRPEARTLPVWLRAFVQATKETDWAAIMAGSTLCAIPVVVFFLIVQGRMAQGMVAGAVKG